MKRLNINSQKHGLRWLEFETQEQLDQYLNTIGDHWGIIATQQIIPAVIDPETLVEINPEQIINIPGTVEYTVVDITAEIQAKALIETGIKRQELGSKIIAQVFAINEAKGLSAAGFQTMLENTTLQNIERLLKNGSLRTAKTMIQGLDTSIFTEIEKNQILEMLQDY
jgi:hypothetical protein